MTTHETLMLSFGLLAVLAGDVARAGSVTGLTTFTAGTPAKAAEVNANFTAVKTAVDNNDSRIAALEASVAALQASVTTLQGSLATAQSTIATLQSDLTAAKASITTLQSQAVTFGASNVMALEPYLTVTAAGTPKAVLSGINLQIVNGTGTTATVNGKGNLIIGYDEVRNDTTYFCSNGAYVTQPTCVAGGGTWAVSHKSGSHYLVVGAQNNYSSYGGLVVGIRNTSTGIHGSVSGGALNTASGYGASVSGGNSNTASYYYASVSGGSSNNASGYYSSVSGGAANTASTDHTSVSGGWVNTASAQFASVSGGTYNTASGSYAHVSGGGNGSGAGGNIAGNAYSSILGGVSQTTTSTSQTIPALP